MIAGLVMHEWRLLWRDRRAMIALACLAALVLATFLANALTLARDNAAKAEIAAAERARWLGQDAKDPHSAAHYSIYAFKPAAALAALDLGIEPFVGQALWLEAHVQNDMLYRPQGDATALERAGLVYPASLLISLAPLVAFLLAFASAARERERGTLQLALGAANNPRVFVLAKVLAVWLALLAALLLPLLLASVINALVSATWQTDIALRLGAWAAVMALYTGLFAVAGVAASLFARNARIALVALFGTWALLVLALPRFANLLAEAAQPLPSTQAVKQQLLDEAPSFWSAEASRENEAAILAAAGAARKDDLKKNYRGLELDYTERHSHAVFDRVLGGLHDRVAAQDRAYAALSWLSPAIALQALSPALAGTDFVQHRHFLDAAEHYRRDLVNRMNAEVAAHGPGADGKAYVADASLWAAQAAFDYQPPPLRPGAAAALPALLAWLTAALIWLAAGARRLAP